MYHVYTAPKRFDVILLRNWLIWRQQRCIASHGVSEICIVAAAAATADAAELLDWPPSSVRNNFLDDDFQSHYTHAMLV